MMEMGNGLGEAGLTYPIFINKSLILENKTLMFEEMNISSGNISDLIL